jgi:phage-related protein
MSLARPLPVIFFRTSAGNEPVREWLLSLTKEERRLIGEDIKTVQYRWPLGMPLVRPLRDQVFEVRSRLPNRTARTFFFAAPDALVLLHGIIKKTQQTPADDLTLALKRKTQYLHAHD